MNPQNNGYEKAVNLRGCNIAVSASAGCGKTTAMIKRITDIILKERAEVTSLLAVTFTRAAAAEMKQRLKEELQKYSGDSFIDRQIKDIEISDISTIHSFCSKVCTEFFNIAEIPPDFSIAEENEACLIKSRLLEKITDGYYESKDPLFYELSHIFSYDRSDGGLTDCINQLYNLTVTMPEPEKFLNGGALLSCENDIDINPLTLFLNEDLCAASQDALYKISGQQQICVKNGLLNNNGLFENLRIALACFDRQKDLKYNYSLLQELIALLGVSVKPQKNLESGSLAYFAHERTKELKKDIKKYFEKANENLGLVFSDINSGNLNVIREYLAKLCEITLKFRQEYMLYKLENSLLDFNDLEYYTLKALNCEECRGLLKERYKYIFVDEFQDTNRVQDEIVAKLENCGNLFIVGDMKQSIYKFRGAESVIFKEKTTQPFFCNITLGTNFRSDANILKFINCIFSFIMRESFSLVNYTVSGMLEGSREYRLSDGRPSVIIDVLKGGGEKEKEGFEGGVYSVKKHSGYTAEEDNGSAAIEGRHIAASINNLIGKGTRIICGKEELNKRLLCGKTDLLCYDDITVLVRANKEYTEQLYRQLLEAGIPVSAEFAYSLSEYFEINDLVEYLKVIDNFRQDIPLVTALKSGIGRFTDDELSQIRISCREGRFHEAFIKYAGKGEGGLFEKVKNFYAKALQYAKLSKTLPCPRLLMRIIKDFKYEEYLLSLPGGEDCVSRIDAFLKMIYQKAYSCSLFEFLYFMENVSEEIKLGSKGSAAKSRVHLCTIHASKGLEYPVVYIAGCGRKFNVSNGKKIFMHRDYGLAMDFYDTKTRKKQPSYIKNTLSKICGYEDVCEEINILYVAMTRAKYRLYMCGTADAEKYAPLTGLFDIKNSRSYFDYILNVAVRDKKNYGKLENFLYCSESFDANYEFNITCGNSPEKSALNKGGAAIKEILPLNDYGYPLSAAQPLKNSVSSLNAFDGEYSDSNILFKGDSLEAGTAYHKVLEHMDFSIKKEEIQGFVKSLEGCGIITEGQAKEIDCSVLGRLLDTQTFKLAAKNPSYKEKPFTGIFSCADTGGQTKDGILVQGVIDLLIIDGGEAVIADYKFSNKGRRYLLQRYSKQLKLYSLAAGQILNIKVKKCVIINILTAEEAEI